MTNLYKCIQRLLGAFFIALFCLLIFNNNFTNVKAATTTAALDNAELIMRKYDGISDWKLQPNTPSNQVGNIPIGHDFVNNKDISLGYTFGAARNSNDVVQAGDNTITQPTDSLTSSAAEGTNPIQNNSKINIFLKNGNQYYGILHQGLKSYISSDSSSTPQTASNTSIDFALLTPGSTTDSKFYKDNNLLVQLATYDSNHSKRFYTSTDSNGHLALKLVGFYSKLNVYVEIVLRAAPNGAPVVQRELYVYNPSGSGNKQFQTFYGEDTALSPNMDTSVDNVPMKAIGGGQGLYLDSGSTFTPASKLFVTNNLQDGFDDFMGRVFSNPTNWSVKGKQGYGSSSNMTSPMLPYSSSPIDPINRGDTNAAKDQNLLVGTNASGGTYNVVDKNNKQDTAYTLRWNETNLAGGEVAHFASDIGASVAGVPVPIISKTYKNLTSTNGKNNVGDTLQFTLKAKNNGFSSSWTYSRILDSLPTGLTVKKGSITSSTINGVDYTPDGKIDKGVLTDNNEAIYTFDATINNQAPYNLDANGDLTNEVSFTGHTTGYNDTKVYKDSVKIPVVTPSFKYHFTKLVKNESTDPNGAYTAETAGQKGNIIDYQVQFTSNGTSTLTGANFSDTLPDGLTLVPNSVSLDNVAKDSLNFPVGSLSNNSTHTILFKATVTGIDASTASNTAYLNNVTTSGGTQYPSLATEEPAVVNITAAPKTMSIDEVPTDIDFGSVNLAGIERVLPNVSTTGNLVITHTEDSKFQVNVSYDNDTTDAIHNKETNDKLVNDGGQVLLLNQADTNQWVPLSKEPIPIKNDGFNGSYTRLPLNDYIGSKKWKLRVPGNTKAGAYTGKVTWSIADVPTE